MQSFLTAVITCMMYSAVAITIPQVVQTAYYSRVSLMSEGYFDSPDLDQISNEKPLGRPFYYFNYAAAVSEVEVDSLTGEFTILRSDIVYDAGHSLNPAIDTGQVSMCMGSSIAKYLHPKMQIDIRLVSALMNC